MLFGPLVSSSSFSSLFIPYPLSWAPLWSQRGVGHLERREKLFQKCPVPPAEDGALFSLSSDAGGAAFPMCSSGAAARH